jgi:hypothetical protein
LTDYFKFFFFFFTMMCYIGLNNSITILTKYLFAISGMGFFRVGIKYILIEKILKNYYKFFKKEYKYIYSNFILYLYFLSLFKKFFFYDFQLEFENFNY